MVLSTECVVMEKPKKKPDAPAGSGEDYDY
jgi:hypothetical protein